MALYARPVVARPSETVLDAAPAPRVRIHLQTGGGAVALHAYVAFRMACLTRREVPPGFPRVVGRPLMSGNKTVGVARRTL